MKKILKGFIHSIPYIFLFIVTITSREISKIFPEYILTMKLNTPEGFVFTIGITTIIVGCSFIIVKICDCIDNKIN